MKASLADWQPTEKQIENVNKVVKSGRLTYGPFTRELEEKFAKLHNFKYCIFTNSGTSALQVSLAYLKRKFNWNDGDEILVPAVTFVASVNVILENRLKPVLIDIDPKTLNINPSLIEKKLSGETRAIMPVDLLGRPCDIEPIKYLAKKYGLKIIEDSCESMFVKHANGSIVGSEANIACYSSYLAHIISTGVGGFLCTNDFNWAKDMRSMIWHGRDDYYLSIDDNKKDKAQLLKTRYRFDKPGYSYRLTEMEAALGVDELDRAKEIIAKRQFNAIALRDSLAEFEEYLELPDTLVDNAWMFFPIILKRGIDRNNFCLFLENKGIQTRWIMPLINQPVYRGLWNVYDYPVANQLNRKGFLIGVHHFLTTKELKYIADCFKEYFE